MIEADLFEGVCVWQKYAIMLIEWHWYGFKINKYLVFPNIARIMYAV